MRPTVLGAFLDGVTAIESIAAGLPEEGWARPTPCTMWTAADLAAHVRCIAEDYNKMLDGVLGQQTGPELWGVNLTQHNAARLAALEPEAPLVHLARFGLDARRFAERAAGEWQAVMFQVRGRDWTVGDYTGFCALEWHVHAWDLAASAGIGYFPWCLGVLADWWREALPFLPLGTDSGWEDLLRVSGRRLRDPVRAGHGGVHHAGSRASSPRSRDCGRARFTVA